MSDSRPTKKRKLNFSTQRIKDLESSLISALQTHGSLNGLVDLMEVMKESDGEKLHKCIWATYRIFIRAIETGWFTGKSTAGEVRKWLLNRFDIYLDLLGECMGNREDIIVDSALKIPFSLLKAVSSSLSSETGHPQLHYRAFRVIFPLYLRSERGVVALKEMSKQYDDLRWFVLRELTGLLRRADPSRLIVEYALLFLEGVSTLPQSQKQLNFYIAALSTPPAGLTSSIDTPVDEDEEEDDWRAFFDNKPACEEKPTKEGRASSLSTYAALHSLQSHRQQFSSAWLVLLQHIKTDKEKSTRVLNILHKRILPFLVEPVLLADWIGACVDFGGSMALLALNALFVLIQQHNLDYPDFYTRLYALLDRNILHVRYRARFFRLLELFLSSTHLPSHLIASFLKRLSRLSLNAPTPGVVMVIPFAYNLLKMHKGCMGMIHRPHIESLETDPFLEGEPSPLLTNAIESSLWELQTQTFHYNPTISTLAKIFSEPFTKPHWGMEEFLDHTYGTMYATESKRKITQEPALQLTLEWVPMYKGVAEEGEGMAVDKGNRALELWG